METKVLNYRVIIEPEKMGRKTVFNAYCPTLGLADFGSSVEEALGRIQKLVKFHIESLISDGQPVPRLFSPSALPNHINFYSPASVTQGYTPCDIATDRTLG